MACRLPRSRGCASPVLCHGRCASSRLFPLTTRKEARMDRNPVGWFEIYVQDMNRAKTFYESVLALKLEKLEMPDIEMWAFPMKENAGGAPGSLVKMEGVPSGG